jgi:hypothetical protein
MDLKMRSVFLQAVVFSVFFQAVGRLAADRLLCGIAVALATTVLENQARGQFGEL